MRIGETLGLRHNDIAAAGGITVVRWDNDNGARAKSITSRTVPVSAELVRLYGDYLHAEYRDLDSDYVFVNLWGRPVGRPWTYAAVYDVTSLTDGPQTDTDASEASDSQTRCGGAAYRVSYWKMCGAESKNDASVGSREYQRGRVCRACRTPPLFESGWRDLNPRPRRPE